MIKIGDKVKFKMKRSNGDTIFLEGIVNGKTTNFGQEEYVISEYKGLTPISIRKVERK